MASNPSRPLNQEDEEEEEEEEEEYDDEEEDAEDEDYDPETEDFNAAVTASLAEAEAADDRPGVEILEIPPNQEENQGQEESDDGDEDEEDEKAEEEGEKGKREKIGGLGNKDQSNWGSQLDRSASANCPICLERWTSDGPHRVCCIPCGHVYGKSCLEKWLQRCRKSPGKCPQCNRKFKHKEIINIYAPLIVVPDDDLEKEVCSLRENNEVLKLENSRLREEIKKQKMHPANSESTGRQKMLCLEREPSGGTQRRLCAYPDARLSSSAQTLSGNRFISQDLHRDQSNRCNFVLQKEFRIDGARVMEIDASSQILIISGKAPGFNAEHVLNKISLLGPNEIDKVQLPSNTGVIRDMRVISNGLVLLASLGKRLSLFSLASNNCVLKYDLPAPAWSCSGDLHNPYHIYAGLQNGMLLVFDLRQTSKHMHSLDGLSRHPIHTIHSIVNLDSTRKVFTASSAGPCIWDVGGSGERPFLIPEMNNYGICISLACSSSSDDLVASFRPKVELSNDIMFSQASVSSSPTVSGSGRLGSHVLLKKTNSGSYESYSVGSGNVSEVRMSKSAIISTEGNTPLFACGDELSRRLCLWNLPQFQVHNYLRPHPKPILDLKYARAATGFLGCISEDVCQVFTCF